MILQHGCCRPERAATMAALPTVLPGTCQLRPMSGIRLKMGIELQDPSLSSALDTIQDFFCASWDETKYASSGNKHFFH